MNYETSPVSIKKRKPRKSESSSNVPSSTTVTVDIAIENEKPSSNSSETPARRNGLHCESPQFLDFAESPEFRVGWDDGFEPAKPCDKIKINENENGNKRKSKRKVLSARTLRTQRILSSTCQTETNSCDSDHPESNEFLEWAQSLLCGAPNDQEPQPESPKHNSSLNQSVNNNGKQSPKSNDMKTPKRPLLNHSSPSSNSSTGIYKSLRKRNNNSSLGPIKIPGRQQQGSPLAKFTINNNIESGKEDPNDFFNDSVNELMIKCSQAVESKLNGNETKLKGNDSVNVSNLLDDSANDLILACTQQVEDRLFKQNACDKTKRATLSDVNHANNSNRFNNTPNKTKVQSRKLENNVNNNNKANVNTSRQFVPKQSSNLHKLDCPSSIEFDSPSVISSLSKKLINKGLYQPEFRALNPLPSKKDSTPNPNKIITSSSSKVPEKGAAKHFLSPNTKEATCSSRKRFCHNNNKMAFHGKVAATSSNQDLTSILNEDEDMLSNLDIDKVMSQVPLDIPTTKPSASIQPSKPYVPPQQVKAPEKAKTSIQQIIVPKTKITEEPSQQNQGSKTLKPVQESTRSSICFNGYKPNPVIPPRDLKSNVVKLQQTVPIGPPNQSNGEVKYTQEQIQMKKIEAKRRLALSKRQKSFEIK